ncbi:TolC family protein [Thiomicrorhabdus sp. Milos-T2]|uniref:TolC family protein n=1 Tax=Thiomicrorhabdus sp. Milos-T2 TaxID=90814 RepID=UPI000494D58B|nr:TolC family protein [Thiomicrorhabdus sp. Milos-T2]
MKQGKLVKNKLTVLMLALSASLPLSAYAEKMDFKACVNAALLENPEMSVSDARIKQAQGALSKAESSRLPQVTLSVTGSNSDNALNVFGMKLQQRQASLSDFGFDSATSSAFGSGDYSYQPDKLNHPDAHTDFDTRIEILVPVWNGGKIGSYEDQAQSMIEAAQKGDLAVQQFLTFNVYQAYEAVHAARSYITVAKQAKETADSYVKTTHNLVEQGVVVRSEFLSAKVNQSSAEVALLKAQGQEQIAINTLKMLMSVDASADVDVANRVDLELPVDNAEELMSLALNNNYQLAAKRDEATSTAFAIKAAEAAYYPSFNVMLRQDWNDESLALNNGSYTIAGVVSWKITDFGVTSSSVDMAKASAAQKKSAVKSQENKLRLDVLSTWTKLQIATKQVGSSVLAVQQAGEAQKLIMKRYKNGVSTITEVLAGETQLDKARADLVSARYDVNVLKAKLLLLTGRMDIQRI